MEVKAVKNCMFVDVSDVKNESLRDGFGTLDVNDEQVDALERLQPRPQLRERLR